MASWIQQTASLQRASGYVWDCPGEGNVGFWNAIGSQIQAKSPAMRGLDSGVVEGTVAGGPGADKESETGLLTTSWGVHVRQATGHNRQDDGQLDDGVEQSRRTGP